EGRTALHVAAEHGSLKVLPVITPLVPDAMLWQRGDDGLSPADIAARQGHDEVAAYLRDLVSALSPRSRPTDSADSRLSPRSVSPPQPVSASLSSTKTASLVSAAASRWGEVDALPAAAFDAVARFLALRDRASLLTATRVCRTWCQMLRTASDAWRRVC